MGRLTCLHLDIVLRWSTIDHLVQAEERILGMLGYADDRSSEQSFSSLVYRPVGLLDRTISRPHFGQIWYETKAAVEAFQHDFRV